MVYFEIYGDNDDATLSDYAKIIVVRHGETAWNADGRIQVANQLSKEKAILAMYSSDLKQAFETASIIANRPRVVEVKTDPDLRERHLGDLQGLQLKEAAELKPDAYVASSSSRTDQEIPDFNGRRWRENVTQSEPAKPMTDSINEH
ncbi:hypothetical protein QYF36_012317 [Acer negundo]|nr:hypothetical protein QYF36_012317 [Acer negundo]